MSSPSHLYDFCISERSDDHILWSVFMICLMAMKLLKGLTSHLVYHTYLSYRVDGQGVHSNTLTCAEKFDEGVCVVCTGAVTAWWVSICNWTRSKSNSELTTDFAAVCASGLVSFVGPAFG
ncbi:hypothetical protein GQ600_3231 [Phytophthora cactorum]|nr:hypothetical protein GQ600_3231 [Phytophthora cactorum]